MQAIDTSLIKLKITVQIKKVRNIVLHFSLVREEKKKKATFLC